MRSVFAALVATSALAAATFAAPAAQNPPPNEPRAAEIRRTAIFGGTVITRPGESIENATILLRDGFVEAIGEDVEIPVGYRVHDATGLHIYPGFIDPAVSTSSGAELARARGGAGAHWNDRILPQIEMRQAAGLDAGGRTSLREQGFVIAQVLPDTGVLQGRAAIVLLAEDDEDDRLLGDGAQVATLETGGWGGGYPTAQMGTIALLRQTFDEARWQAAAHAAHAAHPDTVEAPMQADALDALAPVLSGDVPIIFRTRDELEALRAHHLAEEWSLDAAILGSGTEFRRIAEIAETGRPVITPVKYPDAPSVKDPYAADRVTLRELQTWKYAPSNAKRLLDAGVMVTLTTTGTGPSGFHAGVRKAIEAGLPADEALACMTVRPARMLGIDHVAGTIEAGRLANLVVIEGELFDKESKILEVWVAGRRDEVKSRTRFPLDGMFDVLVGGEPVEDLEASIDPEKRRLSIGPIKPDEEEASDEEETETEDEEMDAADDADPEAEDADDAPEEARRDDPVSGTWDCIIQVPEMGELPLTMTFLLVEDDLVTGGMSNDMFSADLAGSFDREASKLSIDMSMEGGPSAQLELEIKGDRLEGTSEMMGRQSSLTGSKIAGLETEDDEKPRKARSGGRLRNIKLSPLGLGFAGDGGMFGLDGDVVGTGVVIEDRVVGSLQTVDGRFVPFELVPRMPEETDDEAGEGEEGAEETEETEETEEDAANETAPLLEELPVPLGVYGRLDQPRQRTVLIQNATIWTVAEDGVLEASDMLVQDGRITAIGSGLEAPADAMVIDGTGLHVTPGLIDCHSHTGISGGVNEGGQNNTAEVGIEDVINPDDIDWFRQLAGGLTAANQLHGSANPIGGRNSVVKIRWGGTVDDMRFDGAPAGIKFALGENVKRGGGYPDTRMGVAAFIEDAFRAADERDEAWNRWRALSDEERDRTLPPRPDHELDVIAEVLAGDRLIHCHSYRQDEILMLLRLCERYGVRIGTLQHILEGYKLADAIAAHGAGASSFSDWWAYKMEVMDAIPYNGALMHEVGVLVSFNSDDDEVATRMNDEAAKAVRWGGMDPHDALAFVTLNPAKQLGIDDRVGSLEIGKDADFVIWNAPPLSAYARCEQTWIDGARLYDRAEAAETHAAAMLERGRLLTEASGGETEKSTDDEGRAGGRRGSRPTRLLARMLMDRENLLLERVARGEDPEAISAGDCGCGSGSMIELARNLARDRARLDAVNSTTLGSEDSE